MSPFPYQSLLNASKLSQGHSGIAGLVSEILLLEERLKAPERQSEYFQMALESHTHHLSGLVDNYNRIRGEFNRYTIHQLQDEVSAQERMILKHAGLSPLIARDMMRSQAQRIIQEMKDMIAVKGITDQLPTIEELKVMPDLLSDILEVSQ